SALIASAARRVLPRVREAKAFEAVLGAFALVGVSVVAVWLDLTLYVSLYSRLHTLLELTALLGAACASGLLLRVVSERWAFLDALLARFSIGALLVTV